MVYGNSKEIFSFAQFLTILVAFDQQSSWFRSDSPTTLKKNQTNKHNKTKQIR